MNRSIEAIPTWSLCYIINGDASGLTDEEIRMVDEAITIYLLNNMLGGPGMNAKLNLALREHNGLVYTVESTKAYDLSNQPIYVF